MDNQMSSSISTTSITLLEATSELADSLLQSEPFLRLHQAEQIVQTNPEAIKLLSEFSTLQKQFQSTRLSGSIAEGDIQRFREVQSEIGMNEVIQEQRLAQELAIALLRQVNQEITQLLGIDFGALTRRSGGCC